MELRKAFLTNMVVHRKGYLCGLPPHVYHLVDTPWYLSYVYFHVISYFNLLYFCLSFSFYYQSKTNQTHKLNKLKTNTNQHTVVYPRGWPPVGYLPRCTSWWIPPDSFSYLYVHFIFYSINFCLLSCRFHFSLFPPLFLLPLFML